MAGLRNEHHVLNPNATETWNVHARLHGYNIPCSEDVTRFWCQPGALMDLETDTVAGACLLYTSPSPRDL